MQSESKIGTAILGGTGYGAGELLRFLCRHPQAEVVSVVSSSKANTSIADTHLHLRGFLDKMFDAQLDLDCLENFEHSVIFAALPHGASSKAILQLMPRVQASGTKIIDLSGDLRLKSEALRLRHYPEVQVEQETVDSFIYGLTELNREQIASAQFIANPGCLASSAILACAPLAANFKLQAVNIDAKTGTSGAGRSPKADFHHPEIHGNMWAYKVLEHRHEPEIIQALENISTSEVELNFVPHVIPAARGIYVTAYALLAEEVERQSLLELYSAFYQNSPFIRLSQSIPQLHQVVLSNFCDIGVFVRARQVVVLAALDNLVKGMVGQAIQNMNIMCGLPETKGLWEPAPGPM